MANTTPKIFRSKSRLINRKKFDYNDDITSDVYRHLYNARLTTVKYSLEKVSKSKWGDDVTISSLSDIKIGQKCVLIGTLYKMMENKPRALDNFNGNEKCAQKRSLLSKNDKLFLEDFHGRIPLHGLSPANWTSGFIIAVFGAETESSKFEVSDFALAGFPLQTPINLKERQSPNNNDQILILSGLSFGSNPQNYFALKLLTDFISGFSDDSELKKISSKITHVIIAGNSLEDLFPAFQIDPLFDDEYGSIESLKAGPLSQLDLFLANLCLSVSVTIMPGDRDPSNCFLPQKPLHRCLLPHSHAVESSFECATNPAIFDYKGISILGSSGQNIADLRRHSELGQLGAMEMSLRNRLVAPTAPDTLPAAPFSRKDCLLVDKTPHLYFCGNSEAFGVKVVAEGEAEVTLLAVPRFSSGGVAVMVDVESLECVPVCFGE